MGLGRPSFRQLRLLKANRNTDYVRHGCDVYHDWFFFSTKIVAHNRSFYLDSLTNCC